MKIEKLLQVAKKRGFVWPSSEIYGGLSGFFDYGPLGVMLKRKVENSWREFFIRTEDNIFEIESSLIMPGKVWEASGHLKNFIDPIVQCTRCKSFFRADELLQEQGGCSEGLSFEQLREKIKQLSPKCPKCKGELGELKVFNLMLRTYVGPADEVEAYLRPETAQGIFVNFKNLLNYARNKLPFGVAQVGKSYRNEISPRQWLIRLREFNQMEIEMFFNPEEAPNIEKFSHLKILVVTREDQLANKEGRTMTIEEFINLALTKYLAYFIAKEFLWYTKLGIPAEAIRFRHMLPEETPHYSRGNFDMEIKFDFGWKEVVGNAYRTDHDLVSHMKASNEDFSVVCGGRKIVPHVVEPSFGIDRTIYAILLYCFREDGRGWTWFQFPPEISPYTVAVFPLVSKDGLPEKAQEVYKLVRGCFDAYYDEAGSIGKRYARADEIGTPFCVTVDYQTLEDNTVTIRLRDTMEQIRVKIEEVAKVLWELVYKK